MRKRKSHAASAPLVSREDWAQLRPVATLAVALWAVATALRTARATRGLAVAQPDQVFQGVEMAHVLWYGYGLVPFEYMPGVALRSHIMPAVYAAVMGISDKLSLPYHSALGALNAVKAFHCAWASTSVLLVVAYVRHLGCTYQAALAAGAVVALHPLLTGLDCLTLSNPFVTPLCLLVCLLADVALDHDAPSRRRRCLAAGILAGITCHVRADSVIVLLPGLLLSPRWTSRFMYSPSMAALRARVQDAVWTVQGGSVAVLGTFMLDSHMFGHWTWAPWNWFVYNIVLSASYIHGVESAWFFVEQYLGTQPALGLAVGALVLAWAIVMSWQLREAALFAPGSTAPRAVLERMLARVAPDALSLPVLLIPALHVVAVFAGFSLIAHKEVRFVHFGVVLLTVLLVLLAQALLFNLAHVLWPLRSAALRDNGGAAAAAAAAAAAGDEQSCAAATATAASAPTAAPAAPSPPSPSRKRAAHALAPEYGGVRATAVAALAAALLTASLWHCSVEDLRSQRAGGKELNQVLAALGMRHDTTGVLVACDWWLTHAWSALHKPVPMGFMTHDHYLAVHPVPQENAWWKQHTMMNHNVFRDHGSDDVGTGLRMLYFNYIVWRQPPSPQAEVVVWQHGFERVDAAQGVVVHHRAARMTQLIAEQGPGAIAAERKRLNIVPPPHLQHLAAEPTELAGKVQ